MAVKPIRQLNAMLKTISTTSATLARVIQPRNLGSSRRCGLTSRRLVIRRRFSALASARLDNGRPWWLAGGSNAVGACAGGGWAGGSGGWLRGGTLAGGGGLLGGVLLGG